MKKTRVLLLAAAVALLLGGSSASAQSFSVIHSFVGSDGSGPAQPLVQARNGFLYGTTSSGGPATSCPDFFGCGAIFRTDGAGNLTVLHFMTESEGAQPSRLLQASDGNFYGTAAYYGVGPATGCGFSHSCGTVFRMDATGHLTVIHYFQGGALDGQTPTGGLIEAADGNLYGTTYAGIVYRITPAGNFTIVHTFDKVRDGAGVNGPLVQGPDGSFYGTASFGGTFDGGTIFKVDAAGNFVALHHFGFPEGRHASRDTAP